jgi:hypothetical protein
MTLTNEERAAYLAALQEMLEDAKAGKEQAEPACGICMNLARRLPHADVGTRPFFVIAELSKGWPQHTGSYEAPVPGRARGRAVWQGQQASLRMSLLEHLIGKLADETKKNALPTNHLTEDAK